VRQGALDHALGCVRERRQFGKRIADFQGIQFMLADMVMPPEAARQLAYVAAAMSNRNDPHITFFAPPRNATSPMSPCRSPPMPCSC
jgi:alkylation response protein AidB-like acyl-CoA dehydrogenase